MAGGDRPQGHLRKLIVAFRQSADTDDLRERSPSGAFEEGLAEPEPVPDPEPDLDVE